MTFFPRLAGAFEVGRDGGREVAMVGSFVEGTEVRKKAREDRVNEMASKDELNGGEKEHDQFWPYLYTPHRLALLWATEVSQKPEFHS